MTSKPDDLPFQHVLRPSLPWRDENRTDCGKPPNEHAMTRDALTVKIAKQGKKRAALTTCMTCMEAAERWPDWNTNPVAFLAREVHGISYWGDTGQESQLRDELRAIVLLIEAHPREFAATLAALKNTVPFGTRRGGGGRRARTCRAATHLRGGPEKRTLR